MGGGGGGGSRGSSTCQLDLCPDDSLKTLPGICGCGVPDDDADQDTIIDCIDNCPNQANTDQADGDQDNVGTLCDCDDNNAALGQTTGNLRYVSPTPTGNNGSGNTCLDSQNPCATINYAISQSIAGDTIILADGTFLENTIQVNKNLNIFGEGPSSTTVNAQQNGRVFIVSEGVEASICGVTITGGFIEGMGSQSNFAPGAGGGVFNDGTLFLSNVDVRENSANLVGGGIWNNTDSEMHIKNSIITLNSAGLSVAGFGNFNLSTMTIDNTSITNNTSSGVAGGGGSSGTSLIITNSVISNNSAPHIAGGLIAGQPLGGIGSVLIQNTLFSENTSSGFGGGMTVLGTSVMIEGSQFINNNAASGGGISVNQGGFVQISESVFSGNDATQNGGGITVSETSSTFILNSTLNDNTATSFGGGVFVNMGSQFHLSNSTLSNNSATLGGGIYETDASSRVTINLSTVTDNTAVVDGGGVYKTSTSTMESYHSIIANNTANDCDTDAGDVLNTANFSLFSDASCTFSSGGNNLPSTNPMLGPLQNNGGPTSTHALMMGSPAIDAGDLDCGIILDQRGEPRPVNVVGADPIDAQARCDIGSYEVQQP